MRRKFFVAAFAALSTTVYAQDFQLKEWEVGVSAGTGSLNLEENTSATGFTLSGGKTFQIFSGLRTTSQLMYNKTNLSVDDGDGAASEFGAAQRISYQVAEIGGIAIRPFGEIGYSVGNANINIAKTLKNNNVDNYGYGGYGYNNNMSDTNTRQTRKIDHDMDYSKMIMAIGTEIDFGGGLVAIAKYDFSRGSYTGTTTDNKEKLEAESMNGYNSYNNNNYYGDDIDTEDNNSGDLTSGVFTIGLAYLF